VSDETERARAVLAAQLALLVRLARDVSSVATIVRRHAARYPPTPVIDRAAALSQELEGEVAEILERATA